MPIHLHRPDEYEKLVSFPATALVNTVNCVGVAGKGVALAFRIAFPENFSAYKKACQEGQVRPGDLFITEGARRWALPGLFRESAPRFIVNFPTKRHWRDASRIEDVVSGLLALNTWISDVRCPSIAIPALGCGNGGLRWADVWSIMENILRGQTTDVHVFPPLHSLPEARVSFQTVEATERR